MLQYWGLQRAGHELAAERQQCAKLAVRDEIGRSAQTTLRFPSQGQEGEWQRTLGSGSL